MDEGWATTFEYLIGTADLGRERAIAFYKQFRVNGWAHDPSVLEDLPIITPEDVLKNQAYGNNAYGKPSLGYLAMKDLLGDAEFKKCLQAYMARWHGKHPSPWDFFDTFNDVSGKDLNWFWRSWYFSNGYIDLAVRGAQQSGRNYAVTVDNVGGFPAPFDVVLGFADGSTTTTHETPAVWQANLSRTTVTVPAAKKVQSVTLAHTIWVDADTTNDGWPRR
jgi:aminopeptidase N